MVNFNDRRNLLETAEQLYILNDVAEPNLYRDIFPYGEVPKIAFNNRLVPTNMPGEIFITDTTFRDGQQTRAPYTPGQIVDLYKLLHRLGGPKGIIRQSEFFLYTEKDREAARKCLELGYEFPEVTSWIRASKKDFEMVKDFGLKETGILMSCSDYHIFNKMKMTRKQALEHYLSIIKLAFEVGIRPRCHLEDITRADFYGFVVPFATEITKLSREANIPVKIRACDTMGYGVSFPGAALPRSVPGIIYGLMHHADVPSELLEWHGHNDFYKVVANASTAWLYGAAAVNCSLLGIGERTGNCPLEAMVFEYASLRGTLDGMEPTVITEIAEYYERELGDSIPPQTPFVGRQFNVTRAGIHADGILKDEEIYTIFDTKKLLNRPAEVAITEYSGAAGIAHWLKNHAGIDAAKTDPLVAFIKEAVDADYAGGRTTIYTDAELFALMKVYI